MTLRQEVSEEFLRSLPHWLQEERAPTAEEYRDWAKGQKGACQEYEPMRPLSHFQGMCSFYIANHYQHCGVPFVSKLFCRTGQVDEEKSKHLTTKDFRRNFDRWKRGVITYCCDECGGFFQSGRAREAPFHCGECAARLRREGRGPIQQKRSG